MNNIEYLIKFVSKKQYALDLIAGNLYMHTARYYHRLEEKNGVGQGDIGEAAVFSWYQIYKDLDVPIFCTYSVEETDCSDGYVSIDKEIIQDFSCESGYLVIISFKEFERRLKKCNTNGFSLIGRKILYGNLSFENASDLAIMDKPYHLFVKRKEFEKQKEYRLVVEMSLSNITTDTESDTIGNEPIVLNEETAIFKIPGGLKDISNVYEIEKLNDYNDTYIVPLKKDIIIEGY